MQTAKNEKDFFFDEVGDSHLQQAEQTIKNEYPELYQQYRKEIGLMSEQQAQAKLQAEQQARQLALDELKRHSELKAQQQAIADRQAQARAEKLKSLGEDKVAVHGESYYGKIIDIIDNAVIQQVGRGIVLHDRLRGSEYKAGQIWELDYKDTAMTGAVNTRRDERAEYQAKKSHQPDQDINKTQDPNKGR